MKASDLFVKCLEKEGVTRIFGVPGEENADFMISLADSEQIEFILTRHEQGAAFMAEVHGRLTGAPGLCLGTLGPGATNLITGVADSNMDRSPMVVLTGQADSKRQHKESHQAMDVVSMFKPVTKWAHSILHPDNIPEVVRKAFKLAVEEKPGACHIELAEDIAEMATEKSPIDAQPVRRAVPADKIVDDAFALIAAAKRPIILAGNGTIRKRASAQLRSFVEKTGIGVVSTFMAKGCVDMDSEQCLYTVGLQAKDHATCAIDAADVVICLGYDMVEYHPRLWNANTEHKLIHIDFLAAEVDENYRVDVEIVGDLAHTLWMLNERLDALDKQPSYDLKYQSAARREMKADLEEYSEDDTVGTIRPQKALWDARQVMGADDILLSDVGAHKMWIARHYQCHSPNTCLIPNGFCSMGFALPGAISAGMVFPERRVLAICGDAGFLMNVQEMETAKRYGVNITVMVWEDHAYGLIKWKQETQFGKHTDLDFGNPDFMKLADSFGWQGIYVDKSAELAPALEKSFQTPGPSLVVIPIDYRENNLLTQRLGDIACPI
ncbi:MAG: acetolactate synthase-1/2/3 large subunit [Candidatus Binatia bacterium]|jgi:acetolactate synthase-1/2/3 large subunit